MIKPISAFVSVMAFGYLVGAFVNGDFNSENWDMVFKSLLSAFATVLGIAAADFARIE